MATTLTRDGELTYFSFPIEKTEEVDGDLMVWGKATDGSLDRDLQVVDPEWSRKALESWLSSGGNVRVQHQAQRDPAGKGLELDFTQDGHWLKALVVEPVAKELVRKGVLTAYSIGISHPQIDRDPTGKAINGVIRGGENTEVAEVSLVDRPANRNCGITLVKAAADGTPEYVGELFGDEDVIAKAAGDGDGVVTKVTGSAFSPSDMAKLAAKKAELEAAEKAAEPDSVKDTGGGGEDVVAKVVGDGRFADAVVDRLAAALKADVSKRQMDPDVGGGADRDKIPAEDFAGRNRSFPIVTPGDVSDAASSIGRAGSDNYSTDQLKANIIRIAKRKGPQFVAELPDSWKAEEPDATKGAKDCPNCGQSYHADSKKRTCENCGADLPAASKAGDGELAAKKSAKSTCTKCGMKAKKDAKFCSNCGTQLPAPPGDDDDGDSVDKGATPGDGVKDKDTDPVPSHREPDGAQTEIFENDAGLQDGDEKEEGTSEPAPTWGKTVDYATARLHDALCAAYHPDTITATYPTLKNVAAAVDAQAWQDDAQTLIASGDLETGQRAVQAASAAKAIAAAHPDALADARAALHKAFGDMHPGVGPALTPATMTPGKFKRPYLSAGHIPLSAAASGAQRPAPTVRGVNADDFTRGYLKPGHADPSPAAKGDNSPSHGGAPAYAAAQVAAAETAIKELHDHIAGRHEHLCPMTPADHGRPSTVGGGDAGVIHPVATKAAEASEVKNFLTLEEAAALTKSHLEGLVTADAVEKMLAQRDETIAQLRRELDDLAAQPDPNYAPVRGIVATKSTTSGGGPVDRRSLIDEAIHKEHADKVAYMRLLTKSGNPVLADQARTELERLLNLESSEPTAP